MSPSAHSVYSFSGASRWFEDACPASIRLTRGLRDSSNPAAELGTGAHELGEFCIKTDIHPSECIGMQVGVYSDTKLPIIVDAEMVEAVELYYGYAKDIMIKTGVKPQLELRVVMSSLGRQDVYGTSDFTLFDPRNRTLYVSDYKHGFGIVDVENNKQLIGYGISTLDTLGIWEQVDKVVTTIIQPRVDHINGCIRSVEYTTAELVNWQQRFANSIRVAEDPTTKASAGEHCKYCRKVRCRPRFDYIMEMAHPETDINELSEGEMMHIYNHLSTIKTFIDKVKDDVIDIARKTGRTPEGTKPVHNSPHAKVNDEKGLIKALEKEGIDPALVYEQKLKAKTAVKKLLPVDLLNKFYVTPPSRITIAPLTSNKPAIKVGSAEGVFQPIVTTTNGVFTPIK